MQGPVVRRHRARAGRASQAGAGSERCSESQRGAAALRGGADSCEWNRGAGGSVSGIRSRDGVSQADDRALCGLEQSQGNKSEEQGWSWRPDDRRGGEGTGVWGEARAEGSP